MPFRIWPRVCPHAVSLMETVRTYGQTLELVESNKGWLAAEYRNELQRMISKAPTATGETIAIFTPFVREFASVVAVLQGKTNNLINLYKGILRAAQDLSTCSYTTEAFSELLGKIQAAIHMVQLWCPPARSIA
ncbi:hypothetical protein CVT26_013219 [Gymnopilus dilepis]|uniref:Dynein heavy chain tail domain-containing protein n=1 Tax=Gymnopilus dilepis TaxID=231916 RepID=A0A409X000_9AGAR|nr:hypothetical protein CVT26_013219 [Gymnopilus dilepis]